MIDQKLLDNLYNKQGKSLQEIADYLDCSLRKVQYWMNKYDIKTRSRSDALYLKYNPDGDPFNFNKPSSYKTFHLMGLGLGFYWGEGTKASKSGIRLGNSDPYLINKFIEFLIKIYGVKKEDLRFGLQVFSDINPKKALNFWAKFLKAKHGQFYKVIVTPSRGVGTYRKKLEYGVLTVYYNNTKLRKIIGEHLKEIGFKNF